MVEVAVRAVVGILLIAHGLVHLLYISPDATDPKYPFTLRRSWVVPEGSRRPVAAALMAGTVAGFVLLALAIWGVPGLSDAWRVIAVIASGLSLVLLIAFWDLRLSFGILIDVAVVAYALAAQDQLISAVAGSTGAG